jgi:hypothetical protein
MPGCIISNLRTRYNVMLLTAISPESEAARATGRGVVTD